MKKHNRITIAAACLLAAGLLFAAPASASEGGEYIASLSQQRIDLIEENIVVALKSGIPGVQADAAQLVRDLKDLRSEQEFSACVVPLMAIVKNEDADQSARILAALALDRLESEMGSFAISRTAQFTDNPRVKYVCTWLAYERKFGKPAADKGMAIIEPLDEFNY
jgi:hypothetical protein